MGRPPTDSLSDYDPHAKLPKPGTRWVWEIDQPGARALLEVVEVFWNGEQWWVETRTLMGQGAFPLFPPGAPETLLNELGRFWQAVTPVGGPVTERIYERVDDPTTRERIQT